MEIDLILPNPHPAQKEIIAKSSRFNHLRCGRRFGKTKLISELCLPALEHAQPIGIWYPTYKDAADTWKAVKNTYKQVIKRKDETLKQIELITGGNIHFWAMDNPESGQGFFYARAIVDEAVKAHKFKEAWQETIRPTLTDLGGDAWIMSRPKPNTYFKDLEDEHKNKYNWSFFHYTTYDNPHIDREEIESAKIDLDTYSFDQEYLAEYVDPEANYFFYKFDENKHVGETVLLPDIPLKLSFDFNIDPFATIAYQTPKPGIINVLHEIQLKNSDIHEMCDYIKAQYPDHTYIVTGDVSGKNRTGMVRGKTSYWQEIRKSLKLRDFQIRLRSKNLDHYSSRIICNSVLQNKMITINPSCKHLTHDLKYAVVDSKGILKDRGKNKQDLGDTFRYAADCEHPEILKRY